MAVNPGYSAHFQDPLYESLILDAAPFGSDQGADMLHEVEMAGGSIPSDATIDSLLPWGDAASFFTDAEAGDTDGLQMIYAAGFLLLRYTGELSRADYQLLVDALKGIVRLMDIEEITTTVLPDVESYAQRR